MRLKKIAIFAIAASISLTALPSMSNAAQLTPDASTTETATNSAVEMRLKEIQNMDKSSMSSFEKKELRKELRSMKKEQRDTKGVYISVGAAIIIILLLILIL